MRPRRHFRSAELERQPDHVVYEQRLREAFTTPGLTWKQRLQLAGLAFVGRMVGLACTLLPFALLWALWQFYTWVEQ